MSYNTKEITELINTIKSIGIFIIIAYITQFIANLIIILELPKIRRNTEFEIEEELEEDTEKD